MMKTTTASVLLAIAALAGCTSVEDGPDPIVSSWESAEPVGGFYNSLEIEDDLSGDATIYFYASDGYLYYLEFDVEAEIDEAGRYTLELECNGDCGDYDFEMECDMSSLGDEMDCDGDGIWSQYAFEWKQD
jgi:hypothetical protein